jgi:hypothetical protein
MFDAWVSAIADRRYNAMDWKNKLYFGDNLKILREYVADASASVIPAKAGIHPGNLICLDPPFNSSASLVAAIYDRRAPRSRRPHVAATGSAEESAARANALADTASRKGKGEVWTG